LFGPHSTWYISINLTIMGENEKKPHDGSYKKKWNGKKKYYSKPAAPPEKFKAARMSWMETILTVQDTVSLIGS
jgi:hypothetical protein